MDGSERGELVLARRWCGLARRVQRADTFPRFLSFAASPPAAAAGAGRALRTRRVVFAGFGFRVRVRFGLFGVSVRHRHSRSVFSMLASGSAGRTRFPLSRSLVCRVVGVHSYTRSPPSRSPTASPPFLAFRGGHPAALRSCRVRAYVAARAKLYAVFVSSFAVRDVDVRRLRHRHPVARPSVVCAPLAAPSPRTTRLVRLFSAGTACRLRRRLLAAAGSRTRLPTAPSCRRLRSSR